MLKNVYTYLKTWFKVFAKTLKYLFVLALTLFCLYGISRFTRDYGTYKFYENIDLFEWWEASPGPMSFDEWTEWQNNTGSKLYSNYDEYRIAYWEIAAEGGFISEHTEAKREVAYIYYIENYFVECLVAILLIISIIAFIIARYRKNAVS